MLNNEGSKLYLTDKKQSVREKVFKDSYKYGGFFKGKVFSEADFNFTTKEYFYADVYVVISNGIKIGAVIITAIVAADVIPYFSANVQALMYYCSTFGIKEGFQMYRYLGVTNLPNGVVSWIQTDMSDGDSSVDDLAGSYSTKWKEGIIETQENNAGTDIPKSFIMKDLTINGKEVWVHGNATKHMAEYVKSADGSILVKNELMLSFQDAVKKLLSNIKSGKHIYNINGWEIGIDGESSVIYHALYRGGR